MKKYLPLFILAFFVLIININAQNGIDIKARKRAIDSLNVELSKTNIDTIKLNLYYKISLQYWLYKNDSTEYYINISLNIAKKNNLKPQIKQDLIDLSYLNETIGNYPRALESILMGLEIAEDEKDTKWIAENIFSMGVLCSDEKDYNKALMYHKKCYLSYYKNLDFKLQESFIYENIGDDYMNLNKLDSALIYIQKGYEIALIKKQKDDLFLSLENLGEVNMRMENYDIAMSYFRKSYLYMPIGDYQLYLNIANTFQKINKYDSAIYYAKKGYYNSLNYSILKGIMSSTKLLTTLYTLKNNIDSSFKYQNEMIIAKDSILSVDKINKFEILNINEMKRQNDIEELKNKNEEQNKRNIQIAGIAIFIPSFFFFFLYISKKPINKKAIEVLGILSLLMVFEFITLVTHPFVERFTHETPILMILILVAMGFVLVPLHHKLEHWVKGKVLGKNNEMKGINKEYKKD